MADDQAHAQSGDIPGQGDAGLLGELLGDGHQDDEGGVKIHGDGHDDAGDAEGDGRVLDADDPQGQVGDLLGAAGLIQQLAQDDAQGDDDAGHGGAEAGSDAGGNAGQGQPGAEADQDGGADQGQERVDLELDDHQHQQGDAKKKNDH